MADWGQNVAEKQTSCALVRPFLNYLCPVRSAVRLQTKRELLSCPLGAFSVQLQRQQKVTGLWYMEYVSSRKVKGKR